MQLIEGRRPTTPQEGAAEGGGDDAEVARQLHRDMNGTPSRNTRRRGNPRAQPAAKQEEQKDEWSDASDASDASDMRTYRPA
jgi:hypothetical protein